MKPIIGITSTADEKRLMLNKAYINAIVRAGGAPIVLPNKLEGAREIFEILDGILFSGGGDIDAGFFNQPLHEKADGINLERDVFELELLKMAKKAQKPVLGICRGVQLINVALGGDIIQHVDGHSQELERHETSHNVEIFGNTLLSGLMGRDSVAVNSFHHQVLNRLGEGLRITAKSEDGFIEAVESDGAWFCVGVQWHPEAMLENPYETLQVGLFKALTEASTKHDV